MRFEILYNPKIKSPSPCWVWRDDCIFWATALLIALQQRIHPMPGTDPAFVDISFVAAVSACCRCPYSRDTPRGGLWITLSNQKNQKSSARVSQPTSTTHMGRFDHGRGTFWLVGRFDSRGRFDQYHWNVLTETDWDVLTGGTFWPVTEWSWERKVHKHNPVEKFFAHHPKVSRCASHMKTNCCAAISYTENFYMQTFSIGESTY